MVAEAECICRPAVAFQYLCVAPPKIEAEFFDVPRPDVAATTMSVEISRRESVRIHVPDLIFLFS